jgi:hypothetical protein
MSRIETIRPLQEGEVGNSCRTGSLSDQVVREQQHEQDESLYQRAGTGPTSVIDEIRNDVEGKRSITVLSTFVV